MSLPPKSKLKETLTHYSTTFGAGLVARGIPARTDGHENNTFAFKNTTDVSVSVTFEGSDDSTFTDAWPLVGSLTLAAGSTAATYGYETITDAWTFVRPVITPAGNPTLGSLMWWHMAKGA